MDKWTAIAIIGFAFAMAGMVGITTCGESKKSDAPTTQIQPNCDSLIQVIAVQQRNIDSLIVDRLIADSIIRERDRTIRVYKSNIQKPVNTRIRGPTQ